MFLSGYNNGEGEESGRERGERGKIKGEGRGEKERGRGEGERKRGRGERERLGIEENEKKKCTASWAFANIGLTRQFGLKRRLYLSLHQFYRYCFRQRRKGVHVLLFDISAASNNVRSGTI